jgi:hypothetical protein
MRSADFLAPRGDRCHRQHIVFHRTIAHRIGARSAGGGHAADRGVGAGIDWKKQAGIAQIDVQRLPRDPRLHRTVKIAGINFKHLVHAAHINADAAVGSVDMPFQ